NSLKRCGPMSWRESDDLVLPHSEKGRSSRLEGENGRMRRHATPPDARQPADEGGARRNHNFARLPPQTESGCAGVTMRWSNSTFGIALATVDCGSKKVPKVANLRLNRLFMNP